MMLRKHGLVLHNLLVIILISFTVSQTLYVSKNGTDTNGCGTHLDDACGTLYFASTIANVNDSIFVHDGQNKDEINKYFNTNESIYHPCLPIPWLFDWHAGYDLTLSVSFDSLYIHNMNDWFMKGICYDNNKTFQYRNKALFHIETSLWSSRVIFNFNNLRVDNINTDSIPFSIFYINNYHGDDGFISVSCNECFFNNINFTINIPMIYILINNIEFILNNSVFTNINSSSDLLGVQLHDDARLFLEIYNTSIISSTFNGTLMHMSPDTGVIDSTFSDCQMIISGSRFINIETQESIITINFLTKIDISNTIFQNILNGSIIDTDVPVATTLLINMNNIFISTSQSIKHNPYGMFNFDSNTNVTLNNINVIYYYDLNINCDYNKHNQTCECNNPVSFMYNEGYVTMDGYNSFNANITYFNTSNITCMFRSVSNGDVPAFITNYGELTVNNLIFDSITLGDYIFFSSGAIFRLQNVSINAKAVQVHAPQPLALILSYDNKAYIDNCILMGGIYTIIQSVKADIIQITNTIFQQFKAVIMARQIGNLVMNNSKFYDMVPLNSSNDCGNTPLDLVEVVNVSLWNNTFSYYPQCGLAQFQSGFNLLMQNNLFIINYTHIKPWQHIPYIVSIDRQSETSRLINNQFRNNHERVPWLDYGSNTGINCISGNTMDNFAIRLDHTNLTSCIRPEIMKCFFTKDLCQDGMYGMIDKNINTNMKSVFTINNNMSYIWQMVDSYMSLDNVEIQNGSIKFRQGNIFLVDSYLIPYDLSMDIWYDNASCYLIYNDRLVGNTNQIAKLMIKCNQNYNSDSYLLASMNATSTQIVNHFSAKIFYFFFINNEPNYSPGSLIKFYYQITDIFGNVINDSTNYTAYIVNINNDNLSLSVPIKIDQFGHCDICVSGITIFGANLLDTLHKTYQIQMRLDNDNLQLYDDYMSLKIVGCPPGFGATKNKYQCEMCGFGTYNLKNVSNQECLSCEQSVNKGLTCSDGAIYIMSNHWVKINNQSLSSSICPYSYCCPNASGCSLNNSYLSGNGLCALNRDPTSILCSKCIKGYSHVFKSTNCKKCPNSFYVLPFIFFLLYGLFITFYILLSQSDIQKIQSNESYFHKTHRSSTMTSLLNMHKSYSFRLIKLLLFNGILYYEQSLSQLITHTNVSTSSISWWISLCNISIFQSG
eukprot:503347_1